MAPRHKQRTWSVQNIQLIAVLPFMLTSVHFCHKGTRESLCNCVQAPVFDLTI